MWLTWFYLGYSDKVWAQQHTLDAINPEQLSVKTEHKPGLVRFGLDRLKNTFQFHKHGLHTQGHPGEQRFLCCVCTKQERTLIL